MGRSSVRFPNNIFHKNIPNSYDLQSHKERYSRNPKQSDTELKLFHLWHLKSKAKFQNLLK